MRLVIQSIAVLLLIVSSSALRAGQTEAADQRVVEDTRLQSALGGEQARFLR